jgi:hypothetical protein
MRWARQTLRTAAPLALTVSAAACVHVKTDPVEIKPIHIVADVNVNVKIERELDDVFGFSQKSSPATTQNTSSSAPPAGNVGVAQR